MSVVQASTTAVLDDRSGSGRRSRSSRSGRTTRSEQAKRRDRPDDVARSQTGRPARHARRSKAPERIAWVDVVRAVGMLMIIVTHLLYDYTASFFSATLFAVHVPVFFVLSGYLYRRHPFRQVVTGGIRNLLLPYIGAVLLMLGVTRLAAVIPSCVWNADPIEILTAAAYGVGTPTTTPAWLPLVGGAPMPSIGAVWFLLAMFLGNLVFSLVMRAQEVLDEKTGMRLPWLAGIVSFAGAVAGFWLSTAGLLPWSVNAMLEALPFYWFGVLLRRYDVIERPFRMLGVVGIIVGAGLWCLSALSGFFYINAGYAANPLLAELGGMGGSLVIMLLARIICSRLWVPGALLRFGQNSIVVLVVHLVNAKYIAVGNMIYLALLDRFGSMAGIVAIVAFNVAVCLVAVYLIPHIPLVRWVFLNRQFSGRRKPKGRHARKR